MQLQVVGIGERRSGEAKKTGRPYDGMSVYCLSAANDVDGMKAEEVYFNYLSSVSFPDVKVGDLIDVDYDRRGYMVSVTLTKEAK